jgi:hypothetical protein
MRGVIGHTSQREIPLVMLGGVRVSAAADTWCRLAPLMSLDELIEAGERLLGRPRPLSTQSDISEAIHNYGSRRGARLLTEASTFLRERVESPRETRTRLVLIRSGLPEPEVNIPVIDQHGELIAICDMFYRQYRVAVEYEGQHHAFSPTQFARDVDRYNDLAAVGCLVIRVTKQMPPREIARRTREALLSRGWRP